jgi:hypothetical protein
MDEVLCCLEDFLISYADDPWLNPEPFYSLEAPLTLQFPSTS